MDMKKQIKQLPLILFLTWSIEAHAASQSISWAAVLIKAMPILIFIVSFVVIMKWSQKKVNEVNNKIAESNEEIAQQIKRIADHLEKNS